jgi:hypothetical protein
MLTYARMLRFPDRPDALPLDLIRVFETTSSQNLGLNFLDFRYSNFDIDKFEIHHILYSSL